METTPEFTRHLISYDSDGLTVYGFMNIPSGEGPFPVVIVIHILAGESDALFEKRVAEFLKAAFE